MSTLITNDPVADDASPQEQAARGIYPNSDHADATQQAGDPSQPAKPARNTAEVLYSAQSEFGHSIPDDALDHTLLPADERKESIASARELAREMGMTPNEVTALQNLGAQYRNQPPTDSDREGWRRTTQQEMRLQYGSEAERERAMQDARAYAAKHPGIAEQLQANGLGDHPQVVRMFADLARRARGRGELS